MGPKACFVDMEQGTGAVEVLSEHRGRWGKDPAINFMSREERGSDHQLISSTGRPDRASEQGPSRYRYLPTLDAPGGAWMGPQKHARLPSYPNIYPN